MSHLLDTNICIYAMKGQPAVLARFDVKGRSNLAVSVITEAELRTGVAKSPAAVKKLRDLERFLAPLTSFSFTSEDSIVYAELRARLERSGKTIGPMDLLIAAQALARRLTLVTNNTREFSRVRGIELENWTVQG